jgi:hypothetical protein
MGKFLATIGIRQSNGFWFAIATACLLLVGAFWQWVIIDWVTPFLFPAVQLIGLAFFAASLAVSILSLVLRLRRGHGLNVGPLTINLVTVVLLLSVPFTSLWLDANYYWHRASRIQVVEQVHAGVLKPNVPHNAHLVRLDISSTLSMGGNEVVVRDSPQGSYVLFFTFRGTFIRCGNREKAV